MDSKNSKIYISKKRQAEQAHLMEQARLREEIELALAMQGLDSLDALDIQEELESYR